MPDPGYFAKLRAFLNGRHRRQIRSSYRRRVSRRSRSASEDLFGLESLEPRVLLAADLAGAIQAVQIVDPVVPQQNGSATVRITNSGDARTPGGVDVNVSVYASVDQTFDTGDVLLGTGQAKGRLNVGESQNVTVALTFPSTLPPGSQSLLSRVDPANVIAENSETNNVAVGPSINVAWQFGSVPNHAGTTNLVLRDADGTTVTFSLTGGGTGEIIRDGSQWDVRLTSTTSQSLFTIQTTGGNGRVSIDDIHVQGPLGALVAGTMDLTGNLTVDGSVTAGFLLGSAMDAAITAPVIQGTTIQGVNVQGIAVGGNLSQSTIDVAGTLGNFFVGGSMTGSTVQAGSINSIRINGTLSADSRFVATSLPATAMIGGQTIALAGDPRFITDNAAPVMMAQLKTDTGTLATDQRTFDPTIIGTVTDASLASFKAGFSTNPTFDVLADRQTNGSFEFSRARLEQIKGGPLNDGSHTLTLAATDQFDRTTQISVTFTLDTTLTTLSLDLHAASDTAPVGDQHTTAEAVTLEGETEAGALVQLVGLGRETTADANGDFSFAEVSLVLGANAFTAQATDTAGNQRTESRTITRVAVNQAPIVNDQSFSIAENSANGTVVGTIAAQDPDAGDTRTFAITGGTGQTAFAVNVTTGEITVTNGTLLNFENTPSFTLDVQVTDAGNLSDTAVITVNVTNANEVPIVDDQSFIIAENSPNGTVVGAIATRDPDAGDTRTFAITGGTGAAAFGVNNTTGQIIVINSSRLDFETSPSFSFNVQVMDAGGLIDTAVMRINLTDVNEGGIPPSVGAPSGLLIRHTDGPFPFTDFLSIAAVDPDGDPNVEMTWSATGGRLFKPQGFPPNRYVFEWDVPGYTTIPLSITVTDATGLSTTRAFDVRYEPI